MHAGSLCPDKIVAPKDSSGMLYGLEERYRAIFDQAIEIIFLVSLDTRCLIEVNPAFQRVLGYTESESAGLDIYDIIAHDKESIELNIQHIQKERRYFIGERLYRCKDGTLVDLDVNASLITYCGKETLCVMARDIAERKRAEEALRKSKDYLDKIINSISDPIFVKDRQHRSILVNDAVCRLFGRTRGDIIGKTACDLFTKEQADISWEKDEEVFSRGVESVNEETITYAPGLTLTVLVKKTLYTDNAGNQFLVGITRDITERKRLEQMLIQERDRAKKLLDIAGVIILALDTEGRVTLINEKACEILACKKEEIMGKNWCETFIPQRIRAEMESDFKKLISGEIEPVEYLENPILTCRGEEKVIAWHNTIIRDDGGKVLITLSSGEDITQRKKAEEALKESQRRLADIINFLPDPTFVVNRAGQVIAWNHAIEAMTGVKAKDILGKGNYEYSLPFHGQRRPALIDLVLKPQEEIIGAYSKTEWKDNTLIGEDYLTSPSGAEVYLVGVASVLYDSKGNIAGAIESLRDITERKLAEEKNLQLAAIVESSDDAIFSVTLDGVIESWNRGAEKIYSYIEKEIIGKSIFSLVPPERQEEVPMVLEKIKRGEHIDHFESVSLRKDGRPINVSLTISPIFDACGRVIGSSTIARDITEHKLAEEALRLEKSNLEMVTQNMGAGLAIISRDYHTIWANGVIQDTFGDCRGKVCHVAYNQLDEICSGCGVREVFENGVEKAVHDQPGKDSNGKTIWSQIIATPIKDSTGEITAALELVVPITERKSYEERLEASVQEKEVLLREIHHRVKNNLQVISSLLKLQADYAKNEPAGVALQQSQNRIKAMALVHEELYGAKDLAKIDLELYIRSLTRYLIRSYGVERRIELKLDTEKVFLGLDRSIPFGLIINEIVTNCIKHAFPGGKEGEISITLHSEKGKTKLAISDNGIGISESLDMQNPKSFGLALVYSLVRQLKGTIEINSNDGTEIKIAFSTKRVLGE